MESSDVLSLPLSTYLWILGVAMLGGFVAYLDKSSTITWVGATRTALTSAFNGFMMFCICYDEGASTAFTLLAVGISGLMGKRAWDDFVSILRLKLSITAPTNPLPTETGQESPLPGNPEPNQPTGREHQGVEP